MASKQRDSFVKKALSYDGYLEKRTNAQLEDFKANAGTGNYTLFGKWYDDYYKTRGFNGAAWCHSFVSYVAYAVGIGNNVIPYTASCRTGMNWFKQRNRWHNRAGYKPRIGDIIYFSRDGKNPVHVGIVYSTDASRVYTVEGNTSGADTLVENGGGVAKKSYPLTSTYILGYGTPDYAEDKDVTADYKAIIQKRVGFSDPNGVWEILDKHPYAEDLYRKWAVSYK